jgi:hypothetical protein
MLTDPNIESSANIDAAVEWRDKRTKYIARCKNLSEKANNLVPDQIKSQIPHPDTDEIQKLKIVQKLLCKDIDVPFDMYDGNFDENSEEFFLLLNELPEYNEGSGEYNDDLLEPEEPINNSGPGEIDCINIEIFIADEIELQSQKPESDKFHEKKKRDRENDKNKRTTKKRKIADK